MSREINQAGLELVKSFEGFEDSAYICPAGVLTIGYGHAGGDVTQGQCINKTTAEQLLRADLASACASVERLVTVSLSENQFSALASFAFNCGAGNLGESTLLKKLNRGDYDAVPTELSRWVKASDPVTGRKRTLAGLVRRRAAEGELWLADAGAAPSADHAVMAQRIEPRLSPITTVSLRVAVCACAVGRAWNLTLMPCWRWEVELTSCSAGVIGRKSISTAMVLSTAGFSQPIYSQWHRKCKQRKPCQAQKLAKLPQISLAQLAKAVAHFFDKGLWHFKGGKVPTLV